MCHLCVLCVGLCMVHMRWVSFVCAVCRERDKMNERDTALINGKRFYNTGKPCRAGHLSDRYASTGNCVRCIEIRGDLLQSKKTLGREQLRENPALFATTLPPSAMLVFRALRDKLVSLPEKQAAELIACLEAINEST